MNEIKTFYNPGALGDIIYSLPFCLSVAGIYSFNELNNGNKFNFISDGAVTQYIINSNTYQSLLSIKQLLQTQPYFNHIIMKEELIKEN